MMSIGRLLVFAVIFSLVATGALHYVGVGKATKHGETSIYVLGEKAIMGSYARADRLFLEFKYDEALAAYQTALAELPSSNEAPQAMYQVAKCLEEMGRQRDAAAAYEAFLKHHNGHKLTYKAQDRIEYLRSIATN